MTMPLECFAILHYVRTYRRLMFLEEVKNDYDVELLSNHRKYYLMIDR